jgi:hypothetical protein
MLVVCYSELENAETKTTFEPWALPSQKGSFDCAADSLREPAALLRVTELMWGDLG